MMGHRVERQRDDGAPRLDRRQVRARPTTVESNAAPGARGPDRIRDRSPLFVPVG